MLTGKAKVVTIITAFEAQDLVAGAFADLGVKRYSSLRVDGLGAHGRKHSGLSGNKNLEYVILASASLAEKVLAWVDLELLPRYPSVAYSTDATAVTAEPLF
ncbi:MAG TPA: hypothetical protein VHG72_14840 [Polyangia bacterium]|nr:hypothetical protein [Polyangia bacterium]